MASFRTMPNGSVQAIIRTGPYANKPLYGVFPDKVLARQWAEPIEAQCKRGAVVDYRPLQVTSVKDLFEKYRDEVSVTKKGERWERNRINAYIRDCAWIHMRLSDDLVGALMHWRLGRLREVTKATVERDFNLISAVFAKAKLGWRIPVSNPVSEMEGVRTDKRNRKRRGVVWSAEDIKLALEHLNFDVDRAPKSCRDELGWYIALAVQQGVRRGALTRTKLEWIDLPQRCVHYPETVIKNDEDFDCPLSKDAMGLLAKLRGHRINQGIEVLFTRQPDTITNTWGNVVRREMAKIIDPRFTGLRLHDLRHTFTTVTVGKMMRRGMEKNTMQLSLLALTGRKSLDTMQEYFHPSAAELAKAFLDD